MSRTMRINATRAQELRAAIIGANGRLIDYELDLEESGLAKGNIYKATVAKAEPSLNAAFIEYGSPKQGFLPVNDVCPTAYHAEPRTAGKPTISEVLRRRRKILVQVVREAVGSKGAALTTYLSLAGRFLVLMPYDSSRGISRKIEKDSERRKLRAIAKKLELPDGYGFIIRTSALGRTNEEIQQDLNNLLETWGEVERKANDRKVKTNSCIYQDNDLIVRMLRDQLTTDVDRVIVDTPEALEAALGYVRRAMPQREGSVELWQGPNSLFGAFGLEEQLRTLESRVVEMPSGASLAIDYTEALTVIDVNSGRATRQSSQSETAFRTNLEAAREIARQLRLRDIGGLVVVDFIDMAMRKHDTAVEKELKKALRTDRARTYITNISDNGLMEINRQRLRQQLRLRSHSTCPTCGGHGTVPTFESVCYRVIRHIDERASRGRIREALVDLHPKVSDYIQNNFRREMTELEVKYDIQIKVSGRLGIESWEHSIFWKDRAVSQRTAPPTPRPTRASTPVRAAPAPAAAVVEANDEATDDDADDKDLSRSQRRRLRRKLKRNHDRQPSADGDETPSADDEPQDDGPTVTDPMELLQSVSELPDLEGPPDAWNVFGEEGEAPATTEAGERDEDAAEPPPRRKRTRSRRRRRAAPARQSGESTEVVGTAAETEASDGASTEAVEAAPAVPAVEAQSPPEAVQAGEAAATTNETAETPEQEPATRWRKRTAASEEGAAPSETRRTAAESSDEVETPASAKPATRRRRKAAKSEVKEEAAAE